MNFALLRSQLVDARPEALPQIRGAISQALALGIITEAQFEELWKLTDITRAVAPAIRPKSRAGSSPRSPASMRRRRQLSRDGRMPPAMRELFTQGEAAALEVIVLEVKRGGECRLAMEAIAARAGVCKTVAKNAVRAARKAGLILVRYREKGCRRNDTNIITIVSPEWLAWLKVGPKVMSKSLAAVIVATTQVGSVTGTKICRYPGEDSGWLNPRASGGMRLGAGQELPF